MFSDPSQKGHFGTTTAAVLLRINRHVNVQCHVSLRIFNAEMCFSMM